MKGQIGVNGFFHCSFYFLNSCGSGDVFHDDHANEKHGLESHDSTS